MPTWQLSNRCWWNKGLKVEINQKEQPHKTNFAETKAKLDQTQLLTTHTLL